MSFPCATGAVLMTAYKRMDRDALAAQTRLWRESGLRVVFTNGCFDLLHVGHVRYLAAARAEGDRLVVGLNSDASVRNIKGPLRPLVPEDQRAELLSALECVDRVTLFDEPDPLHLILALRPDVLAKGADWAEEDIIGASEVRGWGGHVARIRVVEGASTTGIIARIQERYGGSS